MTWEDNATDLCIIGELLGLQLQICQSVFQLDAGRLNYGHVELRLAIHLGFLIRDIDGSKFRVESGPTSLILIENSTFNRVSLSNSLVKSLSLDALSSKFAFISASSRYFLHIENCVTRLSTF
ncbi:hypothetical protein WR25_04617 [Diploscapter pachys]|uniref:Uncharacterized protein n=1 Tax=Diploscapter pachys TaxID=2018661 RepID=A0A2A2LKV9_9BILA|nr:hypothetical protein WR25_04617 [Diploscapter pachys]